MSITLNYSFDKIDTVFNYYNFKSKPGVYMIFDWDGDLLYIGKTKNILNRIREHLRGYQKEHAIYKYRNLFYQVKVIYCDYEDATAYEPYFIKKLKPILNIDFALENLTDEQTTILEEKKNKYTNKYNEFYKQVNYKKFKTKCKNRIVNDLLPYLKNNPNKSLVLGKLGAIKFREWLKNNWKYHNNVIIEICKELNISIEIKGKSEYKYFKYTLD